MIIQKNTNITEEIKSRIRLEKYISQFSELKSEGSRELAGKHHLHDSISGTSLKVNPEKQVWHCYNCKQGGDIFDFAGYNLFGSSYNKNSDHFKRCIEVLCNYAGIEYKEITYTEEIQEKRLLQNILTDAAEFYKKEFTGEVRINFKQQRMYTDEILEKFDVGYAPPYKKALFKHLSIEKKYSSDDILKTGLFVLANNSNIIDRFQGRIIYPFYSHGKVQYFIAGRTEYTPDVEWEKGKYKKLPVQSEKNPYISSLIQNNVFYCEDYAYSAKIIFITEGMTDCITLIQDGYSAIAPCSSQFREEDSEKLADLCRDKKIYICNDSEKSQAGLKGAFKTAEKLLEYGIQAKIIKLPNPEEIEGYEKEKIDVNEFRKIYSKDKFDQLVMEAKTIIELALDELHKNCEAEKVENVISKLIHLNQIEQERYLNLILDTTGYGKKILQRILKAFQQKALQKIEHTEVEAEEIKLSEEEEAAAIEKLKEPTLLHKIGGIMDRLGIAGEFKNRLLLYLIFTTRLTFEALQPLIKAESSTGKSYIVKVVLKLIPKNQWEEFTDATPKSYYHMPEDALKNKILFISEYNGMQSTEYSIRIMQSENKLSLSTPVKDPVTGEFVTKKKELDATGLCIVVTTTKTNIHDENETRCISIYLDDSEEQRRRVREVTVRKYDPHYQEISEEEIKEWQNIQLVLKYYPVRIPYISKLGEVFPLDKARVNRDFKKVTDIIAASALLHQYQRKIETYNGQEWIVASVADLTIAQELLQESMKDTLAELSPKSKQLLKIIKRPTKDDHTYKTLIQETGWKRTTVVKYLDSLVAQGYVACEKSGKENIFSFIKNTDEITIFPEAAIINEIYLHEYSQTPDMVVYDPVTGEVAPAPHELEAENA